MAIFVKLDGIVANSPELTNRIANQNPQNLDRSPEADKKEFARGADSASFSESARDQWSSTEAAAQIDEPAIYDAGGMSRALEGDPDRPFAVDLRH